MWYENLVRLMPWFALLIVGAAVYWNRRRLGIFVEFWHFMRIRKRWWLLPILVALMLLALVIVLGEALGPFMYAIF